jgi:ELWxxDGT repeat protein
VPPVLDPHDPYRALVYFDQCGWNGYVHAGVHRRVFRFSDSHLTGSFKDAGLPDNAEVIYDDYRTSEFAGILCVSGEAYVCNEELAPCYIRGGREMWISDGTSLGTVRVSDINPGLASSDPAYITNVGGAVLFSAYQSPFGRELWRSDGTRLGTVMVADIFVGIGSSNPTYMLLVNGACSWWLRGCVACMCTTHRGAALSASMQVPSSSLRATTYTAASCGGRQDCQLTT